MFNSIEIKNGIVHNNVKFDFSSGVTAITGPNGCGKSLLAEFMAFALFGSCALRGKVTDYKGLEVSASVCLNNKPYLIIRTLKDCQIVQRGKVLCVGTKPCNQLVISLLGYNYSIYKMGNYAEQLDILGLGKMKPAERKKAMDLVLGLGAIDGIIKEANDKALAYKHESEGIKSAMVEAVEPVKPENYEPVNKLTEESGELFQTLDKYQCGLQWLEANRDIREPIAPTSSVFEESDLIMDQLRKKTRLEEKVKLYQKLKDSIQYNKDELEVLSKQWLDYKDYLVYQQQLELYADIEPEITQEELLKQKVALSDYEIYLQELEIYKVGQVSCPKCGHEFNPSFKEPLTEVKVPVYSKEYLNVQEKRLRNKVARDSLQVKEPVEQPSISEQTIQERRAKVVLLDTMSAEIPEVEEQLSELSHYTDEYLRKRFEYENALMVYQKDLKNYQFYKEEHDKTQDYINSVDYETVNNRYQEIQAKISACQNYEWQYSLYLSTKVIYDEQMIKYNNAVRQSDRYKKASENMKLMKNKVKQFVLPSLSRVSSQLLAEMSDGLYNKVQVDEDFNVLVEGKEIGLFSGSEQAMINLALRLGLGQVLTYKTFSVFIGDEIDASMRDDRAQLTANCLRKVSKYIKQTILISHRDITADHYINLN